MKYVRFNMPDGRYVVDAGKGGESPYIKILLVIKELEQEIKE